VKWYGPEEMKMISQKSKTSQKCALCTTYKVEIDKKENTE